MSVRLASPHPISRTPNTIKSLTNMNILGRSFSATKLCVKYTMNWMSNNPFSILTFLAMTPGNQISVMWPKLKSSSFLGYRLLTLKCIALASTYHYLTKAPDKVINRSWMKKSVSLKLILNPISLLTVKIKKIYKIRGYQRLSTNWKCPKVLIPLSLL